MMIVVIFMGALLIVAGIVSIGRVKMLDIKNKSFVKRCSCSVEGIVIDVKMKSLPIDNGITLLSYNPTIEFDVGNAAAPNLMKKKYKPVNSLYEYRAGQKVKVFYNPKNHEEFYLDCDDKKKTKMIDYKAGALFILIGLVIAAVPLAVLYR